MPDTAARSAPSAHRPPARDGGPDVTRPRAEAEARILAAAEEVFATAGFKGATVQAIADRAGLPKANVHYYYNTKTQLYRTVLATVLERWLDAFRHIRDEADPATALAAYIAEKMAASRDRPLASKLFATEVIQGGVHLDDRLSGRLRVLVEEKSAVLERWVAAGRMQPVSPPHLFFSLWAMTQTYADFDVQVAAVLGRERLDRADFDRATAEVTRLVLSGCGLTPPEG